MLKVIGTPIKNTPSDYKKQLFIDDLLNHGWERSGGAMYEERGCKCGGWPVKYTYHGHTPIWFRHPRLAGTLLMFKNGSFHVIADERRTICYGFEAYNEVFKDIFKPIEHPVSDPFYN